MGGDYGFAWNPHGDYASELIVFRRPRRLHAAGNHSLCHEDRGRNPGPRPTSWARSSPASWPTCSIVDGDVATNIRLLEDRRRILAVIQGGILKAGTLAGGGKVG